MPDRKSTSENPRNGNVSDIVIGTELNQTYKIDSLIGVGGMGEVFRGHNLQTGDPVAIKIVLPEFSGDEMILNLFRKEARILNHLSHDAIVRYYVFTIDRAIGRPYLAMEFVDGPSLAKKLESGPLTEAEVELLRIRLSDGLHRAHEASVIHRDISPDNIILPGGSVASAKIIDFGIARTSSLGERTLLGSTFAGKYNYVSPEQLGLFGGQVSAKSDIYSLGLVLAAALRGLPLEMSGSQFDVVQKRQSIPDLSSLPAKQRSLFEMMLQPDPAKRIGSMAAVRDWNFRQAAAPGYSAEQTVVRPDGEARPRLSAPRHTVSESGRAQREPSTGGGARRRILPIALIAGGFATIAVFGAGGWYYVHGLSAGQGNLADAAQGLPPEQGNAQQSQSAASGGQSPAGGTGQLAGGPQAKGVDAETDAIKRIIAGFSPGTCFHAEVTSSALNSGDVAEYGSSAASFNAFKQAFDKTAGLSAVVRQHLVAVPQCEVIAALPKLSSPGARPLSIQMANEGGAEALGAKGNYVLEATVLDIGPRNVSILLVSDDGGVQNINRICAKCLSMAGSSMKVRLPLTPPSDTVDAATQQQSYRPVLLLAVASPRNLFSISSQSLYAASEVIPLLAGEIAGTQDVSTGISYFKLPRGS